MEIMDTKTTLDLRLAMVSEQLSSRGILHPAILDAFMSSADPFIKRVRTNTVVVITSNAGISNNNLLAI